MKHLIKVDYSCRDVATDGRWFVVDSDDRPNIGVIKVTPLGKGLLPAHECKRYYHSQVCEEDATCQWQEVLEVRDYSGEVAKELGAPEIGRLEERIKALIGF